MNKPTNIPEFTIKLVIDQQGLKLNAEITVNAHCREDAELAAEMVLQSKFGVNFDYGWFVKD
jgi:hypothetical protein